MAFQKVQKADLKVVKSNSIANTEYDEALGELAPGELGFQAVEKDKARGFALTLHKAARRLGKHLIVEQTEYNGEYGVSIRLATASEAAAQDAKRDKAKEKAAQKPATTPATAAAKQAPTPLKKTGS